MVIAFTELSNRFPGLVFRFGLGCQRLGASDQDPTEALVAGGLVPFCEPDGQILGGEILQIHRIEISFGFRSGNIKIVHEVLSVGGARYPGRSA